MVRSQVLYTFCTYGFTAVNENPFEVITYIKENVWEDRGRKGGCGRWPVECIWSESNSDYYIKPI